VVTTLGKDCLKRSNSSSGGFWEDCLLFGRRRVSQGWMKIGENTRLMFLQSSYKIQAGKKELSDLLRNMLR
jgi:hypothetical protein